MKREMERKEMVVTDDEEVTRAPTCSSKVSAC